jgi:hypothetical protein
MHREVEKHMSSMSMRGLLLLVGLFTGCFKPGEDDDPPCPPNLAKTCPCATGEGFQTCLSDGSSYSPCECPEGSTDEGDGGGDGVDSGDVDSEDDGAVDPDTSSEEGVEPDGCVPGQIVSCPCADGSGMQTCTEERVFGECACPRPPPFCGDGTLDPSEECDDANALDDDGCRVDCLRSVCWFGDFCTEDEDCGAPYACITGTDPMGGDYNFCGIPCDGGCEPGWWCAHSFGTQCLPVGACESFGCPDGQTCDAFTGQCTCFADADCGANGSCKQFDPWVSGCGCGNDEWCEELFGPGWSCFAESGICRPLCESLYDCAYAQGDFCG